MQTVPEGDWLCGKSMSFHKVEHFKASYKIRVCLIKGGDQCTKKMFDTAESIPFLQYDSQIDFKRLIMLSL